ncbi:hypothetical protein PG997_005943 [Apiospora hydei]|uniref:SP-RING-type domain-containing protein n=1 Tax=Apiospora hydei TaxID=1337664 RepID=A0ABR1WMG3_9PEZI
MGFGRVSNYCRASLCISPKPDTRPSSHLRTTYHAPRSAPTFGLSPPTTFERDALLRPPRAQTGPPRAARVRAPSCPLDKPSRRQLLDLASQQHTHKYHEQLAHTLKMLEESVRDINDNYAERKHELKARQAKRREKGGGGGGGGNEEEPSELERIVKESVLRLRDLVPELTASSEEAVRDLIDWQVEVEDEQKAVREIQALLEDEASAAQVHAEAEPDEEPLEVKGPRRFLAEAREAQAAEYGSKSMYQKYGMNNDYVHFKKLWHDAGGGGGGGGDEAEDSDEDLIVAGEVQDYRCPLSMIVMKEPYTSKVCKHSFEKAAILEYLPKNGADKRCPMAGCDKSMRKSDLYFDDLLVRRIKRATAQEAGAQEDDDVDEDEEGDVSMRVTAERDIKSERGRDRGRRLIEDIMGDD